MPTGAKFPLSLVIRAVDGVTKPLEAINAKLEKTGARVAGPFSLLSTRVRALGAAAGVPAIASSLGRTGEAAGALGSKLAGLGTLFAGVFTGATLGGLGLVALVRSAEAAGSRLNDMSTRTGLTVQQFAELEFAAKKAGVGGDEFAGGMEKLNRALSEARRGTGPLFASLKKDGGTAFLVQLKGAKSNEEAFGLLAKAMRDLKDPGKQAVLAVAAFGRGGAGMVNVLKDGPEGVAKLRTEFARLAGDQTKFAKNSDALGDSFDALEVSLLGVRNVAAGALMPALTSLTSAVTDFVVKNRDGIQRWAERTGAAIQGWIDGGGVDRLVTGLGKLADTVSGLLARVGGLENALGIVAAAMLGPSLLAAAKLGLEFAGLGKQVVLLGVRFGTLLVGALGKAALALLAFNYAPLVAGFSAAATAAWGFTAALLANPIVQVGLAVVAFAGLVYLIYKNWTPIKGFFLDLWQSITFYFGQGWAWLSEKGAVAWGGIVSGFTSAWDGVTGFFSGLWDGIIGIFRGAWDTIRPIVDGVLGAVQMIPGLGGSDGIVSETRTMLGSRAPMGAATALPAPASGGAAAVRVDFANLPRGARVASTGDAPMDLNLGYSLAPGT
jgi:hypothetical protein